MRHTLIQNIILFCLLSSIQVLAQPLFLIDKGNAFGRGEKAFLKTADRLSGNAAKKQQMSYKGKTVISLRIFNVNHLDISDEEALNSHRYRGGVAGWERFFSGGSIAVSFLGGVDMAGSEFFDHDMLVNVKRNDQIFSLKTQLLLRKKYIGVNLGGRYWFAEERQRWEHYLLPAFSLHFGYLQHTYLSIGVLDRFLFDLLSISITHHANPADPFSKVGFSLVVAEQKSGIGATANFRLSNRWFLKLKGYALSKAVSVEAGLGLVLGDLL